MDQNGAISLIRRIYLEIAHFTLLPAEATGHYVPLVGVLVFLLRHVQGTYLTTNVLLRQCSGHVYVAWKLSYAALLEANIFV